MTFRKAICAAGLVTSAILSSAALAADNGVRSDEIVFGQAAPLTGPAASIGVDLQLGLRAAFEEANRSGGVKGRKLRLVTADDGYEPTKSIEATRHLLEDEKVFALVGPVGTPTSAATQPIALAAGAPFIGPFTGAEFLRDAAQSNVVNVRASYFQETEEMVERLVKDRAVSRIAILYQDDAFGRAGLEGAQRALKKRGMSLVSEGAFERNTVAVKSALLTIQKGAPEAVIMVGPYKPCAEFIKLSRQIGFNPLFINISFVGSDAFAKELGKVGAGVVVTQVVPFPGDESLPVVARYAAALKSADGNAQPGFVSLEGYVIGRLVIAALDRIDGEPTRKALLDAMLTNTFDLGGAKLVYGPGDNQGMDDVFLSVIQEDGLFRAIKDLKGVNG